MLGDLDRVQGGAAQQLVARDEHVQTLLVVALGIYAWLALNFTKVRGG